MKWISSLLGFGWDMFCLSDTLMFDIYNQLEVYQCISSAKMKMHWCSVQYIDFFHHTSNRFETDITESRDLKTAIMLYCLFSALNCKLYFWI